MGFIENAIENAENEILYRRYAETARAITEPAEEGYRTFPASALNRNLSPEQLVKQYPSASSLESAQLARNMDVDIRERVSGGEPLENVVQDIVDGMPADQLRSLPPGYRNKMLMILDHDAEHLPDILNTRTRLETGYNARSIEHRGAVSGAPIGFSADMLDWMDDKQAELTRATDQMYADNPGLAQTRDAWDTAGPDERVKLMGELHKVHAQTYGYPPADIELYTGRNTAAHYNPLYNKIRINPDELDSSNYKDAEEIAFHESDHAFQNFALSNPGANKFTAELATRLSSYGTSAKIQSLNGDSGDYTANHKYLLSPDESYAYMHHGDDFEAADPRQTEAVSQLKQAFRETAQVRRDGRHAFERDVQNQKPAGTAAPARQDRPWERNDP